MLSRTVRRTVLHTQSKRSFGFGMGEFAIAAGVIAFSGLGSSLVYRYKIAKPDEYLVRTGLFIKDIRVDKKGFQLPFQRYKFIRMEPSNYTFEIHALSKEKIQFKLPGVFTIGPKDDQEAIVRYARLLENMDDPSGPERPKLTQIVLGILEGEVRTTSSTLNMEEIFNDRKTFKETIIKAIQEELDQLGLWVINANIKELQDSGESKYLYNSGQRKEKEIENLAKVSVAEAQKSGDIGAKQHETEKRQEVAKLEAATVTTEKKNMQEQERAVADLEVVKQKMFELTSTARIEAENRYKTKEQELQQELERQRFITETERTRAKVMALATVDAEAVRMNADANLYAKQQEAMGIKSLYDAQAVGLTQMYQSLGQDPKLLTQYLFLKDGLYQQLAKTSADAIQGLQPKITICNVGSDSDYTKPFQDILKMVPPVLTIMEDQFGIKLGKREDN